MLQLKTDRLLEELLKKSEERYLEEKKGRKFSLGIGFTFIDGWRIYLNNFNCKYTNKFKPLKDFYSLNSNGRHFHKKTEILLYVLKSKAQNLKFLSVSQYCFQYT